MQATQTTPCFVRKKLAASFNELQIYYGEPVHFLACRVGITKTDDSP